MHRSGQRLGTNARRDIRWALQQTPGEAVREVTLHGVKISFNTNTKEGARPNPDNNDVDPSIEEPTNVSQVTFIVIDVNSNNDHQHQRYL